VPADAFRPRSISELLDASIQLFRTHYSELLVMSMIAVLPQVAANTYNLAVLIPKYGDRATLYSLPVTLVALLWFVLADSALLVAASDAYLGLGIDRRKAFRQALGRSGTIVWASVLKYLFIWLIFMAVMIATFVAAGVVGAVASGIGAAVGGVGITGRPGTALLVVMAVLAVLVTLAILVFMMIPFARLFAYRVAIVLERRGASASLHRSSNLVRGSTVKVILTFLLVLAIYLAVYGLIFAMVAIPSGSVLIAQSTVGVLGLFIYPIIPIVTTLLYYDLRIRKEGYDIELMAGELDSGLGMRAAGGGPPQAGGGMRNGLGDEGGLPTSLSHPESRIPSP